MRARQNAAEWLRRWRAGDTELEDPFLGRGLALEQDTAREAADLGNLLRDLLRYLYETPTAIARRRALPT